MLRRVIAITVVMGFCSLAVAAPPKKQNIQNKRVEKSAISGPTKVKKRKYKSQKINLRKTKVQKPKKNNTKK